MPYIKSGKIPKIIYHYTKKEHLESIIMSGKIYPSDGLECWFCLSLEDMLEYIRLTLMNEGKKYIDSDLTIKEYGSFNPDDYIILKLKPRYIKNTWYYYVNEDISGQSFEYRTLLQTLDKIKICYKGVLEFKSNIKIYEVKNLISK